MNPCGVWVRIRSRRSEVGQSRHEDALDVGGIGRREDRAAGRLADLVEGADVRVLAIGEAEDAHLAVVGLAGAQPLHELLEGDPAAGVVVAAIRQQQDRKSTRLNSSHPSISYAV